MQDLNKVQLIGRLGQDPEVHYTDRGTARTTFSFATNRTWTDADGQPQTPTEWHRITAWGKLAEITAQYLGKGARVYVEGRIRTNRWSDAGTGEQRSGVEIVIHDLIMLDGREAPPAPTDDVDLEQPAPEPPTAARPTGKASQRKEQGKQPPQRRRVATPAADEDLPF